MFAEVPDDCLLEVFKFLDIADRVRFERVHSRWQQILNRSWSKQIKLVVRSDPAPFVNTWPCPFSDHQVFECDQIIVNETTNFDETKSTKLFEKLSNLKALTWLIESRLPSSLVEMCPKLVHIENMYGGAIVGLDLDYSKLTCVWLGPEINSPEFVTLCPKLKYFHASALHCDSFSNILKVSTIEKLSIGKLVGQENRDMKLEDKDFRAIVKRMPQLKGLQILGNG